MEIKIDAKGKVTIPKFYREKYNLKPGTDLKLTDRSEELTLTVIHACSACGKALPEELYERGACATCTPKEKKIIQIY